MDGAIEGWVSLDGSFRSVPPGRKGVRGGYPRVASAAADSTLGYFRGSLRDGFREACADALQRLLNQPEHGAWNTL